MGLAPRRDGKNHRAKASYVEDRYGIGRGTVVGGHIGLEINEPLGPSGGEWIWG